MARLGAESNFQTQIPAHTNTLGQNTAKTNLFRAFQCNFGVTQHTWLNTCCFIGSRGSLALANVNFGVSFGFRALPLRSRDAQRSALLAWTSGPILKGNKHSGSSRAVKGHLRIAWQQWPIHRKWGRANRALPVHQLTDKLRLVVLASW